MEITASMRILCDPMQAYDAFADPMKIGNFWFSASSQRWETGKTIGLTYLEYGASFDIQVLEAAPGEHIRYHWGEGADRRLCTLTFEEADGGTIVRVSESQWRRDKDNIAEMLKNQQGWVFMLTCLKAYLENGISTLRTGLMME